MRVIEDFPADSTYMSTFTSRLHVIYNGRGTKLPSFHENLKARPLTHFYYHTDTSNSLLGNVDLNKPELLTKFVITKVRDVIHGLHIIDVARKDCIDATVTLTTSLFHVTRSTAKDDVPRHAQQCEGQWLILDS